MPAILNTERYVFWFLFLCIAGAAKAQGAYEAGFLPAVNINYTLNDDWSVNFKTESRQQFLRGVFSEAQETDYRYLLTDMSVIIARKVGLASRIAGGYLLRVEQGELIHRAIQQYTYVQSLSRFRLGHRLSSDQTYSPVENTEIRLRYRLASEIPLNGETADPKEFYVKISNEYLNSLQGSAYDLEVRLVTLLGYNLSDKQQIEIGVDYRVDSFIDQYAEHSFWTSLSWYIEL